MRKFLLCLLIFTLSVPGISFSVSYEVDKKALQKEFENRMDAAKLYYKKEHYKNAIEEWKEAKNLQPKKAKSIDKLIKNAEIKIEKASRPRKPWLSLKSEKKPKKKEQKPQPRPIISFVKKRSEKELPDKIYRSEKKMSLVSRGKLTLDECVEVAIGNHLPLKIAEKQLKLAEFRTLEAMRKLGPTVTFKMEHSKGTVSGKAYEGQKFLFEGKQPLFYGGELVYSVKQAKTNQEIVKNDYGRIKSELILQVKKAYYSLDKAKKALLIQVKLQKRAGELYGIAKSGYDVEIIPQIEFLEVTSQFNQINFQVTSAEEDISIANLILQQSMNVTDEVAIAEVRKPRIIDLELEDCFNLAFLNRPEIKISQLSIEYFAYERKIMQARSNWPRVDMLGSYGNTFEDYTRDVYNTDYVGQDPRNAGPEWYLGVKISAPIWGSTVNYSYMNESWQPVVQTLHGTKSITNTFSVDFLNKLEDISGAKEGDLEFTRAKEEFNKKRQEITLEVKETYFKYKKSTILMDVAESKVDFQAKQVAVLDIRRELGEALYSDVLEEMIKLGEEEFSYIQAIADYYIAIATLNKAIGIDQYFSE